MMPSQFLDEIPADLIDWKRKEAGMERMRSGWRANALRLACERLA